MEFDAMTLDSAVLVVVDVQRGFVSDHSRHVVPVIADLADRWQRSGGDVVFTRYINYPGSPFERLIHWSRLQSSPEIDLMPELVPIAKHATVIDKGIYSLFSEEGSAAVKAKGWNELFICGIATESCVLKTAVDAFERDLTPWIIEDACASHAGQFAHDAGLLVASRFIGKRQIIHTSDVDSYRQARSAPGRLVL